MHPKIEFYKTLILEIKKITWRQRFISEHDEIHRIRRTHISSFQTQFCQFFDLPIHSSDTKLVQNLIVGYNPDGKNGNL